MLREVLASLETQMDRTSEMSWGSLLYMQLASEVQTARDYFNTHFGLNFPELDANGRAQFENATMSYFQIPFTHYVTVNRWIYPATDCNYSYCMGTLEAGVSKLSMVVFRRLSLILRFCVEHTEVRLEVLFLQESSSCMATTELMPAHNNQY